MRTLKTLRAALLLASISLLPACEQIEMGMLYMANEGTEAKLAHALPLTLRMKEVDGWVMLPARINGSQPVDFVLDTGASVLALIDSDRTRHLGLDMAGAKRLGGEGDLASPTGARQDGLSIDFGGVTLEDQSAFAIPLSSLQCIGDRAVVPPFQGVIGHDLFRRFTVEVNRDRGVVVLHDPETYVYRGSGRIVPAEISGRQPFVEARIAPPSGPPYRARLHVDSGAGIDLSLFPSTSEAIKPPPGGRTKSACFVGGRATYNVGTSVGLVLGKGAATQTPADYALGKEIIDAGQNGRIGARFLARFNVVFDYARERIILEPRRGAARGAQAA